MKFNLHYYFEDFVSLENASQNNVDSSKWSFNYLDTITFSTTPIYIMDNTTNTSTNIALNHFNENISSDWLNTSSKTAK